MKCIRFRSFHFMECVSNFLSCDSLGALCTFLMLVFHFPPCAFVKSSASSRAVCGHPMKHVRVISFEGGHIKLAKL